MGLVGEIIKSAIDEDVSLSVILRKCLVVATQLGNDRLKAWVSGELNGYDDEEELPQYRVINIQAKGLFAGYGGAQINDQPLASAILDEEHRWWATTACLREGIAAYENVLAKDEKSVRILWPGDLVLRYQTKFTQDYVLNRAWQEIPLPGLAAVVDTVRNRLLGFALELQEEIGDAEKPLDQIPAEGIERVITNNIYGGQTIITGNVAGDVQQSGQINISQGDFDALRLFLEKIGVPPNELEALNEAIAQDKEAGAENGFGSRVKGWLGKAGNAVAKVAADTATDTLKKAVMDCLGLP